MTEASGSRSLTKIKLVQPTESWSFSNALSLINNVNNQFIGDSLDEFLLLHLSLLNNGNPFLYDLDSSPIPLTTKELSLHSILYTNITKSNISDSEKLSSLLNFNQKEVLRIICKVCKKFPETKIVDFEKSRKKLPDDKDKALLEERFLLYGGQILRERREVLHVALELLSNKVSRTSSSTVQNIGKDLFLSKKYGLDVINNIRLAINLLTTRGYTTDISVAFDEIYYNETILYIISLLKILIELSVKNPNTTLEMMELWFKLMHDTKFMLGLSPYINEKEPVSLINALATVISVSLIDLENSFGGDGPDSYITNGKVFNEINNIINDDHNSNAILMYTWTIILLRKSYILKDSPDNAFTTHISTDKIDHSINNLGQKCQQLNVFHELEFYNDILKFDNLNSAILSTIVQSAMSLVTLTPEISSSISSVIKSSPSLVVENFFENPATIDSLIVTRAKFPFLLIPFLNIASINGQFAFNELKQLKSYMAVFPKSEITKMTVIDDEDTELVKLNKTIDLFPPYEVNKKLSFMIKDGTRAKILPTSNKDELLVAFLYNFSGFAFLGRTIENLSHVFDPSDDEKVQLAIRLFSLLSQVIKDCSKEDSLYVLKAMSTYTEDSDIIEIALRFLEQGLHSRNIQISQAILDLLYYLVPLASHRIWTYLSNSILLSVGGKEGFVATIFSSIEMINGDFSFSIVFIKLIEALAHDCLSLRDTSIGHLKSKVLTECINHLILVFETFSHCRFNDAFQKMEMGTLILNTFTNILKMVYGLQVQSNGLKATQAFESSAKLIIDSFLITKSDFTRTIYPLLSLIDSLDSNFNYYEVRDITMYYANNWVTSVLSFSEFIVSIRTSLSYLPSAFETALFSKLPILVNTYANYSPLRKYILSLMTALCNGYWPEEPKPSLLSHLGRNNAQVLLNSLIVDLDDDFDNYGIKVSIYDFISAVMSGNQQGLGVLFLGVGDIVDNLTKEKDTQHTEQSHSLIKVLKKNIKDLEYLPDAVALHLVDSLALIMNSWSVVKTTGHDLEIVDQLLRRIDKPMTMPLKKIDDYISACYKLKLISKISEVLALFLFSTKNQDTKAKIVSFLSSDNFFQIVHSHFIIDSYHKYLHDGMELDFKKKFPMYDISDFRSSLVKRNRYGISTIYNLAIMDGAFHEFGDWPWMREKVIASAAELQYVNSQIDVAKSFGALLTSFCSKFPEKIDQKYLDFGVHLLRVNSNEGIPAEFFEDIYHIRIQLTFFIVYTLYNSTKKDLQPRKTFELLKSASELLSSNSMDFISNISNGTGYYRPLLRSIYCALAMIKDDTEILIEYFSIFRQLFEMVVNKAIKILLVEIQNDVYYTQTDPDHKSDKMKERMDDAFLILSVLKIFAQIKLSPNSEHEMTNIVDKNGTIKVLLNLFLFSHLLEIEGEYVFAQFSLMFIQELMRIDTIAHKAIDEGLFTVLRSSPISNTIKNGDINITTYPQYHRIWTNGILPIFLSTLAQLGPSILPEICFGINAFRKQINTCIESWSKDSSTIRISTATVNETGQILLLYQMLTSFDIQLYLGTDKVSGEQSDHIDLPMLPGIDSEAKREDFVDCINNLLKHPKFLTSRITASSIDEKRIIDNGGAPFEKFVYDTIEDIRSLKELV